jgi:hypothetical protein
MTKVTKSAAITTTKISKSPMISAIDHNIAALQWNCHARRVSPAMGNEMVVIKPEIEILHDMSACASDKLGHRTQRAPRRARTG